MRTTSHILMLTTIVLVAACGGKKSPENTVAQIRTLTTQEKPPTPDVGSLWTRSAAGSLYRDRTAVKQGDLLTVLVVEEARSAKNASTRTSREATAGAGIPSLLGLPAMLVKKAPGLSPSTLVDASTETSFNGSGDTVRSGSLEGKVTVVVEDVLPNGNLFVRGGRTVRVNGETEEMTLSGMVRREDIRPDNTILSSAVADARIAYVGKGVVSEKQRVGWFLRVIDWVWPF